MHKAIAFLVLSNLSIFAFWGGITPGKSDDFILFEDFEQKLHWKIEPKQSVKSYGRFIQKEPIFANSVNVNEQKLGKLFAKDQKWLNNSNQFFNRPKNKPARYSYEINCFFFKPGQNYINLLRPQSTTTIGRPLILSMWVRSESKKHVMYAIFSNHHGRKYKVRVSDFDFYGWNRIEIVLPGYIAKRNPRNANKYEFVFHGFRIQSSSKEEASLFVFAYDNIMMLIDKRFDSYRGSEIKDNWN